MTVSVAVPRTMRLSTVAIAPAPIAVAPAPEATDPAPIAVELLAPEAVASLPTATAFVVRPLESAPMATPTLSAEALLPIATALLVLVVETPTATLDRFAFAFRPIAVAEGSLLSFAAPTAVVKRSPSTASDWLNSAACASSAKIDTLVVKTAYAVSFLKLLMPVPLLPATRQDDHRNPHLFGAEASVRGGTELALTLGAAKAPIPITPTHPHTLPHQRRQHIALNSIGFQEKFIRIFKLGDAVSGHADEVATRSPKAWVARIKIWAR